MRKPPALRSNWAIKSNRGKVVLNSRRRRSRILFSMRTVHDRRRSQRRRAWWSPFLARVSRSRTAPLGGCEAEAFLRMVEFCSMSNHTCNMS